MKRRSLFRKSIYLVAGVAVCASMSASAKADLIDWIAISNGNWSTAAAWSSGLLPLAGDDVRNLSLYSIYLNFNTSVRSFTSTGNLSVAGADLSGSQASKASVFKFTSSTLDVAGGGLTNLTFEGNAGVLSFNSDGYNYVSNVDFTGTSTLSGGYTRAFGSNDVKGTSSLSGLEIRIQDGSSFSVLPGGSLSGVGRVSRSNDNSSFNNNGVVTASGGDLYNTALAYGEGLYQSSAGSRFIIDGGITGTGAGATLKHNGGQNLVAGGFLAGKFKDLEVDFNSDGNNIISNLEVLNTSKFGGGYTRAFGANTLGGEGTISGLEIRIQDGSSFSVLPGGSLSGTGRVSRSSDNSSFNNNGTVTASGGDLYNTALAYGEGLYQSSAGSRLLIDGGITGTGAGATLRHNGGENLVYNGGFLAGKFKDLEVDFDSNAYNVISNLEVLNTSKFGGGYTRAFGANTLGGEGTISGLEIRIQDGSSFSVLPGGSLSGTGRVSRSSDNSSFNNNGTVTASGGDLYNTALAYGEGLYQSSAGSRLLIDGGITGTGAGATLRHNGGENLVYNGGFLAGKFKDLEVDFDSNAYNVISNLEVLNTSKLGGGYTRAFGANSLAGAGTISNLDIRIQDGSSLTVKSTGALTGSGYITRSSDNSSFVNEGSLKAVGDLYIDPAAEFKGWQEAPAGSRLFYRGNSAHSTGTWLVNGGAWFTSVPLSVAEGKVKGKGTVNGNIEVARGTLAPGDSTGALTVAGTVSMSADAFFQANLVSLVDANFGQLVGQSSVTVGGTLVANQLGGANWGIGDRFRIISAAGGRFGTFSVIPDAAQWTVEYGTTYVDLIALHAPAAVPEPATLVALGVGAVALLRRRRQI